MNEVGQNCRTANGEMAKREKLDTVRLGCVVNRGDRPRHEFLPQGRDADSKYPAFLLTIGLRVNDVASDSALTEFEVLDIEDWDGVL
jgi:hypothetical protein